MALNGSWNMRRLIREVVGDFDDPANTEQEKILMRERCIDWCQRVGLLRRTMRCPVKIRGEEQCDIIMEAKPSSKSYSAGFTAIGKRFRCRKKKNNREHFDQSIAVDTW